MENETSIWSATGCDVVNRLPDDFDVDTGVTVKSHEPATNYEIVVLYTYLVMTVVGIFGNSLTIFVILRHRRRTRTVATCFILNLAIADDLFLLCLPFMAYSTYTHQWVFGDVVCQLLNAFWGVNQYVSILTTTLMSVDRYLAAVYPLRSLPYRTCSKACISCVVIWAAGFLLVLPLPLYSGVREEQCQVVYCLLLQVLFLPKVGCHGYCL